MSSTRSRRTTRLAAVVAALLVTAFFSVNTSAQRAIAQPDGPAVGWWAGQSTGHCGANDPTTCPRNLSAYTPAAWDALVAGHGFLNFNLVYTSDFGPKVAGVNQRTEAIGIVREANRRGVPISAWITAPLNKGLFANENNAATMLAAVQSFTQWAVANDLHFTSAMLDLEFPVGYQQVFDALDEHDTTALRNSLKGNLNPAHQCQAIRTYRATIAWAHAHSLTLEASPVFFGNDDRRDGNLALSDLMDLAPALPEYDGLYVQAYRAYDVDLGTGFVASEYALAQQQFGTKGQVSLGDTGMNPYTSVGPVVTDIRMLAALGATRVPIFDFDSSVKTFGADGLAAIMAAGHDPMSPSELAAAQVMAPTGKTLEALLTGLDSFAASATPAASALLTGHRQVANKLTTC